MGKRALFITSRPNLYQLSNIFLNNSNDEVECLLADSVSKSVEMIQEHADFDLVFVGHIINKDLELKELTNCLLPLINSGKVQMYGSNKAFAGKDFAKYYNPLVPVTKILTDIYRSLNLGKIIDSKYISFPIGSLQNFLHYPFDCFLKIKKNDGINYIQVFREQDETDKLDIDKYVQKGVKSVYISLARINEKITLLEKLLESELGDVLMSDPDEAFDASAQFTLEVLKESGLNISESALTRNKQAYNNAKHLVKNSKSKNDLKALMCTGDSFYFKHVSMTSLMCCYILDKLKNKDEITRRKLCSAAYFQNIYLEKEEELKIFSDAQLDDFNSVDRKRISNHALMAFEVLAKNPLIEPDILKLIKEQHGDKRGMTFPDIINSSSKMSLIFQIASLFSQKYLIQLEEEGKVNPSEVFNFVASKLAAKDQEILASFREVALEVES